MTFEDYLRNNSKSQNHVIRLNDLKGGEPMSFYIHPLDINGDTRDFMVKGNELYPMTTYLNFAMVVYNGRAKRIPKGLMKAGDLRGMFDVPAAYELLLLMPDNMEPFKVLSPETDIEITGGEAFISSVNPA